MPTALCRGCQRPFEAKSARPYCSHACYGQARRADAAATLVARFWAKVNKTDTCWLWTGCTARGYGQFHLPRTTEGQHTIYAHRYAWQLTNGVIPDNLSVLHRCDVPLCVNPNHLFLGSQAVNLDDARAKGRLIDGRHLIKVDDAGIEDICARYERGNGKQLAAEYGVSLISILRIVNGTQRVAQRHVPRLAPSHSTAHAQAAAGPGRGTAGAPERA